MRILHLSDTHNCHRRLKALPEADVVVHSGDFCMVGNEAEAIDFLNWFCDLSYRQKYSYVAITMNVFMVPMSTDWMRMCIIFATPESRLMVSGSMVCRCSWGIVLLIVKVTTTTASPMKPMF